MTVKLGRVWGLLPVMATAMFLSGVSAAPAMADISGSGCTASATDSTGKAKPASIDIAGTSVWHVSKDSQLSGKGEAPTDQTKGSASASAFGIALIPIASGTGQSRTGSGSLDVSQYADKVRVFSGVGSSDSCSGKLTVVVDDVAALDTLVGKISLGLLIIGILILIAVLVRTRPPETNVFPASLVGMIGGLLAGLGLYELLVQLGSFDPQSSLGLAFPVAGMIVGLLCGIYGGRRVAPLGAPPVAPVEVAP